jgi:hypothetical protein
MLWLSEHISFYLHYALELHICMIWTHLNNLKCKLCEAYHSAWRTEAEERRPHREVGFPAGFCVFCMYVGRSNLTRNFENSLPMNILTSFITDSFLEVLSPIYTHLSHPIKWLQNDTSPLPIVCEGQWKFRIKFESPYNFTSRRHIKSISN